MPESSSSTRTRLLLDLHRGTEIAQTFCESLEPEAIAIRFTSGLVEKFDCAFVRIWLLESNQKFLKLVASSGLHTRTDGTFSRVPLGAYKVGKIAQNRVSFLSNNLAEESWVGNREWVFVNHILGFAGYPLVIQERVIGVLACFSTKALAPEFLEILPTLCTMVSIALDKALQHQQDKQNWQTSSVFPTSSYFSLSDQLAAILGSIRLTLVGTERGLNPPLVYIFLQAAEILHRIGCAYCRLVYTSTSVALDAMIPYISDSKDSIHLAFEELLLPVSCLGGTISTGVEESPQGMEVSITIPQINNQDKQNLCVRCKFPVLQMAFTHLSFLAGLKVCNTIDDYIPLLTDDITQIPSAKLVLWVQQKHQTLPKKIQAKIDLSITAENLREAVDAVVRGESWGIASVKESLPVLSERELEMMRLLIQGLRDRDIANHLIISESTVKFHINNILSKLKAKTRYQALHQAIINGWIY